MIDFSCSNPSHACRHIILDSGSEAGVTVTVSCFTKIATIFIVIYRITCLHRRRVNEPYEVGYPCGTLNARNDENICYLRHSEVLLNRKNPAYFFYLIILSHNTLKKRLPKKTVFLSSFMQLRSYAKLFSIFIHIFDAQCNSVFLRSEFLNKNFYAIANFEFVERIYVFVAHFRNR